MEIKHHFPEQLINPADKVDNFYIYAALYSPALGVMNAEWRMHLMTKWRALRYEMVPQNSTNSISRNGRQMDLDRHCMRGNI